MFNALEFTAPLYHKYHRNIWWVVLSVVRLFQIGMVHLEKKIIRVKNLI